MGAKAKGKIKGVLGRLGDLGAIDKKYDVAVSTACAALDYIVVETTADAQACVAHLRANNLGVATFLILEKQQALEGRMREAAKAASAEKSAAPRLMDLIKPAEPRLAVAFYYGVRDTAVADDLDGASKIAYEGKTRKRVVTLAGQLIETSGTMSGGGPSPGGAHANGTRGAGAGGDGPPPPPVAPAERNSRPRASRTRRRAPPPSPRGKRRKKPRRRSRRWSVRSPNSAPRLRRRRIAPPT